MKKKILFVFLTIVLTMVTAVAEDAFEKCCQKQMKQIYQATMEFVKNNDGYLPIAYSAPNLRVKNGGCWYVVLAPYLKKMGLKVKGKYIKAKRQPDDTVVHCPGNPYWYGGYGPYCTGYLWNMNLGVFGPKTPKSQIKLIKFANIVNKNKTILMTDSGTATRTSYNRMTSPFMGNLKKDVGFWHDGKANVLFMDGHIECLSPAEINAKMFQIKYK